ncbi:hypothetical protein QR680_015629 [Steinernema hermaphroditum]|uniref:Serpentine receptor class gamma n=1 Tax=Steinernema hermaphroditum TaxID=289476 RepID=A0AA39LL86_9BILA|nr:hypothetical protein QR680_015629 [Steinernema hermaphroditum]
MNVFLFQPEEYKRMYSCTAMTTEEWCSNSNDVTVESIIYFTMGTLFLITYVPVLLLMLQRKYTVHSCYRFMIFLGVQDIILLLILTIIQPYVFYVGAVYCCSPTVIYILGCLFKFLWSTQTCTSTLLALNRFSDIIEFKWMRWLFEENRVYGWMALVVAYSGYNFLFFPPVLISSTNRVGSPNPYFGVNDRRVPTINIKEYVSINVLYHDVAFLTVLSTLYVLFIVIVFWKLRAVSTVNMTKAKIKLIVQVSMISGLVYATSICFFLTPKSLQWLNAYVFRVEAGLGGIIYLCCNREIRNDWKTCFTRMWKGKKRVSVVHVTSVQKC